MSDETTTVEAASDGKTAGIEHDDHGHITDKGYVQIFVILAIITAVEVAWSYMDVGPLFIPGLMIMMVVKFFLVAAYFMHLKYDIKMFIFLFAFGLALAGAVYMAFLSASQLWQSFS